MANEFTHLHCHTDYSMLDGACKIKELARVAEELKMSALAITDHGNLCGAMEFYTTLGDYGIKPIIGCEFYLAPTSRFERNPNHPHHRGFHQVILAKNMEGYRNLCRLNAGGYLEGYYFKPRIDHELLSQNVEGLIGTSSCIGGEIPTAILANDMPKARNLLGDYIDIFGKENYYLELQDHGMPEQKTLNEVLLKFSKEFNIPVIATNDAHYVEKEHALPHEVLLCIGTQKTMNDPNRLRFPSEEFYIKSAEEMAALFPNNPEALHNTMAVAEKCNVEFDFNTNHYPVYTTPDGSDRRTYIINQCKIGIGERYAFDLDAVGYDNLDSHQKEIVDRMMFEIDVIDRMGFISYFLVVWDFLDYARQKGIPVGPGRGSGAGSIVAYLLHITDIEPLRYNLLFERFLNPDRVSPPDFDIDLCERRRYEVIEYVRQKYGADSVAQIGTFGTLKAKAVLKDVARAVGRSFEDSNRLTKLVPADPKMTLDKALEASRDLKELKESEAWVEEIFQYSTPLEGLNRNMSIHAAGVIIGDQPLTNIVPLAKGQGDEVITQYPGVPCEMLGLLKMDFLGLRTLTIIKDACDIIKKETGREIVPIELPIDDEASYRLLRSGATTAVFQLESGGMQDLCRRFGVERIEDIIALIALYRPGPMQFIDECISRKFGHTKVEYDHPDMKAILEETWGIMLYQEQVMQVVQKVAGFTLAEADLLRRAMGKKKADVMAAQFEKFLEGCKNNNISEQRARAIFDKIEMFAGYGFNKSHSAAYAFIAYQTAYLKANYPVAFMAANLSNNMHSADGVTILLNECRDMKIDVLPPAVNKSDLDFTVDGDSIRFGLAAIKGVGNAAAEAIINARGDGEFESMLDFCERCGSAVNRRVMESLSRCGAFDSFGLKRAQMFAMIDDVISRAHASIKDREIGQETFFDMLADDDTEGDTIPVPDIPEWDQKDILKSEKELLGFYVTGHPLGEYEQLIKSYSIGSTLKLGEAEDGQGVRMGGLISSLSVKFSKKDGSPWAIIYLEDLEGVTECLAFSKTYAEWAHAITDEAVVMVEARVSLRDAEEKPKLIATKVMDIEQCPEIYTEEIHVRVHESQFNRDAVLQLRELMTKSPGQTVVIMAVICEDGRMAFVEVGNELRITPTVELLRAIEALIGEGSVHIRADKTVPERRQRRREFTPMAS